MVTWALAALLLPLLVFQPGTAIGAAPEPSPPLDSLRVRASGPGRLFLGGNLIEGPWALSYETGRLTVNGYGIAPPKPTAPVQMTPAQLGRADFMKRASTLADSLARSGTDPSKATDIFTALCASNTWGITIVEARPGEVELRTPDGIRINYSFRLTRLMQPVPANERVSRTASRLQTMTFIRNQLERGGVVFLDGKVSQTYILPPYGGCVLKVVAKLKEGVVLDSTELHCIPVIARQQVQHPAALSRYTTSR